MSDRERRGGRIVAAASRPVTERLNAVYGDDGSTSVLDEALETLQFLSMPPDAEWDRLANRSVKAVPRSGSSDPDAC